MNEIMTRQATDKDADSVYNFVCRLESITFDKELFGQYYLQNIHTPGYYYLLAIDINMPVGYLSCHGQLLLHHLNYVYEIQELYVDECYRGKGIGRKLIEHLKTLLAGKDYDMLEVACGFQRPGSHVFYEQVGFRKSHYKFTMPTV
ncbi:MAG: GNAT family N-acetyltransferase [Taibaiella sp.]|nr:GNAT family N-acetyltransferase [Taibaiella sp.]